MTTYPTTGSGAFGTYATLTAISPNNRVVLAASFNTLLAIIPDPVTGVATTYLPDFDQIPPAALLKIRNEIQAIKNSFFLTATVTMTTTSQF